MCKHTGLGYNRFRSPLLSVSRLISFPPGTEMFHFPGLPSFRITWINSMLGYPIRKSPDQRLFAPPRRLTQLTTSFIDSLSQGIHHMHLVAWSHYLISSFRDVKYDLQLVFLFSKISFWRRLFTLLSFQWTDCLYYYQIKSENIMIVEIVGIEPTASYLQSRRSPSWAISPFTNDRDRKSVV